MHAPSFLISSESILHLPFLELIHDLQKWVALGFLRHLNLPFLGIFVGWGDDGTPTLFAAYYDACGSKHGVLTCTILFSGRDTSFAPVQSLPKGSIKQMLMKTKVELGSHVTLHYRLTLPNGQDIVNTFTSKPATLLIGAQQIAAPLETILLDLEIGCHSVVQLDAEAAFGARNPDLVQKVSLELLRTHNVQLDDYQSGDIVEFNATGGRFAGVLKDIEQTYAIFDFNHPLAGQALTFEVQIIGIL